jgi:hypothetical protein
MRRLTILTLLAISVGIATPSASAATPAQRIAKLERQVQTLTSQVKTLQTANRALGRALDANFSADACLAAQTADLVQGTWTVIDQLAQALQSRTYFGPQTQITDNGHCGFLINPEVPRMGIRTPPVITFLETLIDWLG